jgi:hypothetical protein
MYIGPSQCFLLFVLMTGLAGMWRGWLRETITLAITLASVLFLLNGGIEWLWRFVFYSVPQAFNELFFGTSQVYWVQPVGTNLQKPDPYGTFFLWASFIVTVGLGYIFGHRYGGKPKLLLSRVMGGILGAINGVVIVFYATKQLFWGGSVTIVSPDSGFAGLVLPGALGLGLVIVALALLATWSGKAGGEH